MSVVSGCVILFSKMVPKRSSWTTTAHATLLLCSYSASPGDSPWPIKIPSEGGCEEIGTWWAIFLCRDVTFHLKPHRVGLCSWSRYICCCFRGRSRLRGGRHWVEVASAPNAACGVGPLQDASAGAILWARAGPRMGHALVYHRSLFITRYCLSRVSTSSEDCTVTELSDE